jgi:hypothetical protein
MEVEKSFTLDDLKNKVEQQRESQLARLKSRYELAKSLGFTAAEAMILQNKTEEVIRQLAQDKFNNIQ